MQQDSSSSLSALYQQLLQQIDFYFSADNLQRDTFLQGLLHSRDHFGAVPVATICSFPKVKELYAMYMTRQYVPASQAPPADPRVVGAAMQSSRVVRVSDDGHWLVLVSGNEESSTGNASNTTDSGKHGQQPQPQQQMGSSSARTSPTVSPTSFDSGLSQSQNNNGHYSHDNHHVQSIQSSRVTPDKESVAFTVSGGMSGNQQHGVGQSGSGHSSYANHQQQNMHLRPMQQGMVAAGPYNTFAAPFGTITGQAMVMTAANGVPYLVQNAVNTTTQAHPHQLPPLPPLPLHPMQQNQPSPPPSILSSHSTSMHHGLPNHFAYSQSQYLPYATATATNEYYYQHNNTHALPFPLPPTSNSPYNYNNISNHSETDYMIPPRQVYVNVMQLDDAASYYDGASMTHEQLYYSSPSYQEPMNQQHQQHQPSHYIHHNQQRGSFKKNKDGNKQRKNKSHSRDNNHASFHSSASSVNWDHTRHYSSSEASRQHQRSGSLDHNHHNEANYKNTKSKNHESGSQLNHQLSFHESSLNNLNLSQTFGGKVEEDEQSFVLVNTEESGRISQSGGLVALETKPVDGEEGYLPFKASVAREARAAPNQESKVANSSQVHSTAARSQETKTTDSSQAADNCATEEAAPHVHRTYYNKKAGICRPNKPKSEGLPSQEQQQDADTPHPSSKRKSGAFKKKRNKKIPVNVPEEISSKTSSESTNSKSTSAVTKPLVRDYASVVKSSVMKTEPKPVDTSKKEQVTTSSLPTVGQSTIKTPRNDSE